MHKPSGLDKDRFDIVGGGFSGMATAWYLLKSGARVRLFEKGSRLGGLISTLHTPHGLVEQAASGLICTLEVERLFGELDLVPSPAFKKYPRRYIYRGVPRAIPLRGMEWVKVFKLLGEKLRNFRGLKPNAEESLRQWSLRHWGLGITDNLIEPVFQGVFASPSAQLSAGLALKGLTSPLKKGSGPKGTVAPLGGMRELIDRWTVELLRAGAEIHLNSEWPGDEGSQRVVLCLSPQDCARYLSHESPEFLNQLMELPRVGLVSVTAFFEHDQRDLRGFGVLCPRDEGMSALGVLFNSDIFWERKPSYRTEAYIFSEEWAEKSDPEILSAVLKDRERMQGFSAAPKSYYITRRKGALPLYGLRLEKFLRQHDLNRGRFYLFGNSFGEIGLARMLEKAKNLAQQLRSGGHDE